MAQPILRLAKGSGDRDNQPHSSAGTVRASAGSGAANQNPVDLLCPRTCKRSFDGWHLENPTWGQERIANELLLKLGLKVSPRTVRKYMPDHCVGGPGKRRQSQRWSTFIRNHAKGIIACDFCVAVTATFRVLYVFVVIEHASRRLLHVNVTAHPTARVGHAAIPRSDSG